MHEKEKQINEKLGRHESEVIRELREMGYEIETGKVDGPISKHLDPI